MSRIDELLKYAGDYDKLIDVGCDHGYLGITALQKTTASVVFSDISEKCLMKARQNLPSKYTKRAEFLVCDGVPNIDADVVVLAGMGGLNIINILKNSKANISRYILQPMNNIEKLREYVYSRYEVVIDDVIIEDDRFYIFLVVKNTPKSIEINDDIKYFGAFQKPISENKYKFLLYKRNIIKKFLAFNEQSMLQLKSIDSLLNERSNNKE